MAKKTIKPKKTSSTAKAEKAGRTPPSSKGRTLAKAKSRKTQPQQKERIVSAGKALFERAPREQKYLDIAQAIMITLGKDQTVLEINNKGCEVLSYPKEEIIGKNWFQNFIPEDIRENVQNIFQQLMEGELYFVEYFENPVLTKTGEERIISWHNSPLVEKGEIVGIISSGSDITEGKRAEARILGQNRTLEKLAKGGSLQEVLGTLTTEVEKQLAGLKCSILLLDKEDKRLYNGSSPSLPKSYTNAIEGMPIGPNVGSCGTAVYQKAMVIVEDIATDPLWENYKHLALRDGLKACWSTPIFDSHGDVLGTFGLYYDQLRRPSTEEMEIMQSSAYLASLAIENRQSEEKLKEGERKLSTLLSNLPGMVYRCRNDKNWTMEYLSKGCLALTGYQPQHLIQNHSVSYGQNIIHPEDKENVWEEIQNSLRKSEPFHITYRIRTFAGEEKWVSEKGSGTNLSDGGPVVLEGFITDITANKRAQQGFERSQKELRNLSQRLQTIREEEKRHVAREIHDELGQFLTAIKIDLTLLKNELTEEQKPLRERAQTMGEQVDSTIKSIQRICMELRPQILDVLGLSEAVEWQCKEYEINTGTSCDLVAPKEKLNLDQDRSIACFRILQESLTNVTRHAQATRVIVELENRETCLVLKVEDNGKGINEEELSNPNSLGLIGMRERAFAFDGDVKITGRPGKGTTLTAEIPYK